MSCEHVLNFDQSWTNEKHFLKIKSQREFDFGLFIQIYRELLLLVTFFQVHLNSKEVSLAKLPILTVAVPLKLVKISVNQIKNSPTLE